jgi:hypothetical protein
MLRRYPALILVSLPAWAGLFANAVYAHRWDQIAVTAFLFVITNLGVARELPKVARSFERDRDRWRGMGGHPSPQTPLAFRWLKGEA